MKYSILGFNQEKIMQTNLDITDLIILQYIEQACASPKMKHILNEREEPLVWVNHTKFHEDLPILYMAESTLKNRLSNLKKLGYIQSQNVTNANVKGSCTYYGLTEATIDLLYCSDEQTEYCQKYVVDEPRTAKSTSNNKLSSNSKLEVLDNKLSNTTAGSRDTHSSKNSLLPGVIAEKKEKPKKKNRYDTFEDMIVQYTNNIVLQEKLREFVKMRSEMLKEAGRTYYPNQLKGVLAELDTLPGSTEDIITIVDNSLIGHWAHFYPLKDSKTNIKTNPSEKNVVSSKETEEDIKAREAFIEDCKAKGLQYEF